MKKTLALVLAFALVFSTITVAFADTTTAAISADAKACADLGMLVGEGSGVTVEYTATTPSRLQAATMALRLKGLEAEAKAFTGTDNFADVDKVNYADGKAILAYLKAHKELGWVGDGTNFDPTSKVTAQQYYKTLLESLGYKQTTADVAGDFTYAETLAFAATKGLSKAATATNFTIADLATATVEGLKATVKGGTRTLAATLVEAKALDQAKVDAALNGTTAPATAAAVLDTVRATANDKVEVGFDVAVDKAFAENVANYKIIVKGSTTALEVKSAALASDPTFVVLTTAAQTGGTAYAMTVGTTTVNFAGIAKVTGAPEIDTVTCIDTNTVEVVFTKAVDRATAEDVANYTLDKSATVKSAELWASQDDTRKTVKLTTEGVANSKVYTLKISNVKSADAVAMKAASKSFTGITDTKAVAFDGAITVSNDKRIIVHFDDAHGVDEASAETVANWSIKDGSSNELKIESITAKDNDGDDYGYYEDVEIATDAMTSGSKYTVTVSNLVDGSVAKNTLTKALTKTFTGKAADKSAPTVLTCVAISDTAIQIEFDDQNRLDNETLTNLSNYTFEKDITATAVKILRPTKPDLRLGKTVVVTTTAMDSDIKTYKLTVTGVADEFGNVIKTFNKSISYHAEDITPPNVLSTAWVDLNTVTLTFDNTLDSVSAEDPANYTVNGGLGTVVKAEISGNDTNRYKVVTLTTATQDENTKYTITINGVKDLVGNACADAKAYFTSERDGLDVTRPTIESVDLVSEDELRVTFSEKVAKPAANSPLVVQYDNNGVWTATATDPLFLSVGELMDDETTVVYKSQAADISDNDWDFRITSLTGVKDKGSNSFVVDTDDYATFSGNSAANEAAEVDSIEQLDARTIKVVFDKPVTFKAGDDVDDFDGIVNIKAADSGIDVDGDDTNDAESTLTLVTDAPLTYDANYDFDFSNHITDYVAKAVADQTTTTYTRLTATIDDDDAPVIEYVEALSKTKLAIHYNEDILSTAVGTYKIYEDGATTPISAATTAEAVDADDATIVNVTLDSTKLTAGDVYQVKPSSAAKDLSNNSSVTKDVSFSFVASGVVTNEYITGVKVNDARSLTVTTSKAMDDDLTITVLDEDGNELIDTAVTYFPPYAGADGEKSVTLPLLKALEDGVEYTVTINSAAGTDFGDYTFTADIADGGVDIDENDCVTFSAWDTNNYVVKIVYDNNGDDFITAGETYFVVPTALDKFDLTAAKWGVWSTGLVSTIDYNDLDAQDHDVNFTVEVYRTNTEIDASAAAADLTTYFGVGGGAVDYLDGGDNCETNPIYTQLFTVDN